MEYNYSKKSIWKWILLYVVVGAVAYGAVYYFWSYEKGGYSYSPQNYQNNYSTQVPSESQPLSEVNPPKFRELNSIDGKFSAFIEEIEQSGSKIYNFHIYNKQTKTDVIIKKLSCAPQDQDHGSCGLLEIGNYDIRSFSPDNNYILIDSGTDVIRGLEIIRVNDGKTIADFSSFLIHGWINNTEFIFNEPQEANQKSARPWGGGDLMGISKINLLTGEKTILKKADNTHDYYLEINPDGSLVNNNGGPWIYIKTYGATGGDERFENPLIARWIMDTNGKLIKNVDDYENYK